MSKNKGQQKKPNKKPIKSNGQYISLATLLNQGNALQVEGNLKAAIESYQKALAIRDDFAEAHNNLGVVYQKQGLLEQAIACHQRAIAIKPNYVQAYQNLANAFDAQGNFAASFECYQQGFLIEPNSVDLHFNLGCSLKKQDKLQQATESLQRVIALAPNLAEAYLVLGELFKKQGDLKEAIANYQYALKLNPNYAQARLFLGMTFLTLGDYEAGWQYWESRYDRSLPGCNIKPPPFNFLKWQGQSLSGKSLLIWPEQGFGDEIQICRYISVLKKQLGASYITLLCREPLKSLLETLADVDQVLTIAESINIAYHDYWIYSLSLPLYLKTTPANIPKKIPYLYAKPALVKNIASQLKPIKEMRVGICWKGNAAHTNDKKRSPGIEPFSSLFKLTGVKFFTLQPFTRDEFLASAGSAGFDFGREINTSSFEEAAALIMNLDLVIACDTSIAHLAGALGKPLWLVLPFDSDWRWLLEREDSPWYPNARLFRQTQHGGWTEVFAQVETTLKAVIAGEKPAVWSIS